MFHFFCHFMALHQRSTLATDTVEVEQEGRGEDSTLAVFPLQHCRRSREKNARSAGGAPGLEKMSRRIISSRLCEQRAPPRPFSPSLEACQT